MLNGIVILLELIQSKLILLRSPLVRVNPCFSVHFVRYGNSIDFVKVIVNGMLTKSDCSSCLLTGIINWIFSYIVQP